MRDDFTKRTVETLAKQAGYLCSNPDCRCSTVGATQSGQGFVIVGVAAHITAAAPGGPRYDPTLTGEERRHPSNGIWLCPTHSRHVDSDAEHFTVEMLRKWKRSAEEQSFRPNAGSIPGMAQSRRPLEFGDCDEEMTNDHNTPCEDVLRKALMN